MVFYFLAAAKKYMIIIILLAACFHPLKLVSLYAKLNEQANIFITPAAIDH